MIKKACLNCGREFSLKRAGDSKWQRFCSDNCEREYCYKIDMGIIKGKYFVNECRECHKTFISIRKRLYHCSYACSKKSCESKQQKYRCVCKTCGVVFFDKNNKSFCTPHCASVDKTRQTNLKYNIKHQDEIMEISNRTYRTIEEKEWKHVSDDGVYYDSLWHLINGKIITCSHCGKKFARSSSFEIREKNYCSEFCHSKDLSTFIESICLNCGRSYTIQSIDKRFAQFCSDECENDFREKLKDNKLPALINFRESTCNNCHKHYFNITNKSVRFCSGKCHLAFIKKSSVKHKKCKECGKEFFTVGNAQFCCNECMGSYQLKQNKKNGLVLKRDTWNKGKKTPRIYIQKSRDSYMKRLAAGEINPHANYIGGYFKDIPHYCRSSWEINFAKILLYLNRDYRYESRYFALKNSLHYLPDFYDVRRNCFYEIKGKMKKESEQKMNMFRELYPQIKIKVIDEKKYKRIYEYFQNKIDLLDFKQRTTKKEAEKIRITKEQFMQNFGLKDNKYKQWDKSFDKKLGL